MRPSYCSSGSEKLGEAAINQAGTASITRTCPSFAGAMSWQACAAAPRGDLQALVSEVFPPGSDASIPATALLHNNLWGLQSPHNRINDSWLSPVKFLHFAAIVPAVANCRAKEGDRDLRSLDRIVSHGPDHDPWLTIRSEGSGGLALNWRDASLHAKRSPLARTKDR